MAARWFIQGALTVLDATIANEAVLIDRASDDGQRADIHAALN